MSRYIATRALRGANLIVQRVRRALEQGAGRVRPGPQDRVHQHGLLPAHHPGLHRDGGGDHRRTEAGAGPLPHAAARPPEKQDLAALPGRDAGRRRGHPLGRGGHPGASALPMARSRKRCPARADRHQRAQRVGLPERPHRRHPAPKLGHPVGGRPHARLCRHHRLRQDQRGRRRDRAPASAAQHPHLPERQRQRPQHHPPAAWKRAWRWATTPTSCPLAWTPSRPSTRWALPPARR